MENQGGDAVPMRSGSSKLLGFISKLDSIQPNMNQCQMVLYELSAIKGRLAFNLQNKELSKDKFQRQAGFTRLHDTPRPMPHSRVARKAAYLYLRRQRGWRCRSHCRNYRVGKSLNAHLDDNFYSFFHFRIAVVW